MNPRYIAVKDANDEETTPSRPSQKRKHWATKRGESSAKRAKLSASSSSQIALLPFPNGGEHGHLWLYQRPRARIDNNMIEAKMRMIHMEFKFQEALVEL